MTSPFEVRTMKAPQGLGFLPNPPPPHVTDVAMASSLPSRPRACCVFCLRPSFGAEATRSPTCVEGERRTLGPLATPPSPHHFWALVCHLKPEARRGLEWVSQGHTVSPPTLSAHAPCSRTGQGTRGTLGAAMKRNPRETAGPSLNSTSPTRRFLSREQL